MAFACCLSAARSGHVGAQKQLGRMFITGNGVPWSEQDAIYWYRLAAAQGDESARQAVAAYRNTHVPPVLAMLRKIQPSIVSLAFDPEGAGPDTHYKVLQVLHCLGIELSADTRSWGASGGVE